MKQLCAGALVLASSALLLLASCGGPSPSDGDADADADEESDGDTDGDELLIEPPELPVLTPCPDGWSEVAPDPSDPYGCATCEPWPDGDPVTPPNLLPCPTGWREVPPEDPADPLSVTTCDPWPPGGREECAAVDEAHFPGEPGCARVGSECPEGDWSDALPTDAPLVFVHEGEAAGGDGTRELPFGTIAEALAVAEPGTVIALSKGTFDERVLLPAGVTLFGACVAETLLTCSTESEEQGTITAVGADAAVRNLRIGGRRPGLWISGHGRAVELDGVLVQGCETTGLMASDGAVVSGRSVVVRDTASQPSSGDFGAGLIVQYGARVDLRGVLLERNRAAGVVAFDEDTAVALADVAIRETQSRVLDEAFGMGVSVEAGATVTLERAVLEVNHDEALLARGAGATLSVRGAVVRDTAPQTRTLLGGRGLECNGGAAVTLSQVLFQRNSDGAIALFNEGTTAQLTDVVVRDTASQPADDTGGVGLGVAYGAAVTLERASFERGRMAGVIVQTEATASLTNVVIRDTASQASDRLMGQGLLVNTAAVVDADRLLVERSREAGVAVMSEGVLRVTDLVVRDTASRECDGAVGRGLNADSGAEVELTSALLERNREAGVVAQDDGTTLTLRDVTIRDTEGEEVGGLGGRGLGVEAAEVVAERVVIRRASEAGLHVHLGGSLVATDLVILETRARRVDGRFGRGLAVERGGEVEVERALIAQSVEAGVTAFDDDTSATLVDVVVTETSSTEGGTAGTGIVSLCGASIAVTRFVVSDNALCGIQLAHGQTVEELGTLCEEGGMMTLNDGVVSRNPIGINLQVPGFDAGQLIEGVVFRDNEFDLDLGEEVYIPELRLPEW